MLQKLREKYIGMSAQMRATVWFFVCSVLQRGISFITTPIFTRLMSTTEYGQFTVFQSWMSLISIIVTLQLTAGVYTMGIVKFKEDEKIFTSSLQGLNLVLCLVWTIIYWFFRNFFNRLFSLTTVQMLAMMVLVWTTSAFTFWMTTQRNMFRYRALVAVTLGISVVMPALNIWLVLHAEDKVTARIVGTAIVQLAVYTVFFFIQMCRGKVFFSAQYWKYAILFNLPLLPHYLSNSVLSSSDRIMIQRMVGESQAGIYGLAYAVALIMMMVNEALNKTMSPWLYQRIREKDIASMHKVVYPSLAIVGCADLLLIAIAPEVVSIFAPAEYYDAIYVIPPVALSGFAMYMYLCFAPFEFYYEKRIGISISTILSALVNLALNYLCIPVFGYYAAGYTTLICYIMNAGMHYFFMRRICKQSLSGVKPYNSVLLMAMLVAFCSLGFLYIPMYTNRLIRYGYTIILLLLLGLNRKKIMEYIRRNMIEK